MDTTNQNKDSMHDQANTIQEKIDALKDKAESSTADVKDNYNKEIQRLTEEKQNIMDKLKNYESTAKDKAENVLNKFNL